MIGKTEWRKVTIHRYFGVGEILHYWLDWVKLMEDNESGWDSAMDDLEDMFKQMEEKGYYEDYFMARVEDTLWGGHYDEEYVFGNKNKSKMKVIRSY